MSQKLRQEKILQIVEARKYVTVRELIYILQYSSATVNRDLNALQALGLVQRSRGGVEPAHRGGLPPLYTRQFYKKKEKRRIAEEAARQVQNGDTVFLNGGTTVQYMVPFLLEKKNLCIITNSLRLAIDLGESDFEVICLGGRIRERPYVLGGDMTAENAMRYRPDKMFFSFGGIGADGYVAGDSLLNRIMLQNSAEVWLLTDRTKLAVGMKTVLCDFSALTGVISDFDFPEETKRRFPTTSFLTVEK